MKGLFGSLFVYSVLYTIYFVMLYSVCCGMLNQTVPKISSDFSISIVDILATVRQQQFVLLRSTLQANILYLEQRNISSSLRFSHLLEIAAQALSLSPSVDNTAPDFCQDLETIAFLPEHVKKAVKVVIPHYDPALEKEVSLLECQVSFSNLMSSADLEAHHLSFHQVDLPLTHPEILVF